MKNLSIENLDSIYSKYGYEIKKQSKEFRVYVYRKNMYYGADIIPLVHDCNIESIKKEFSRAGYAVLVRDYMDDESVENTLFDGFFNTISNIERNRSKYKEYIERQSRYLGSGIEYQYITSPFSSSSVISKSSIVEHVEDILGSTGANLIIIEAAAGFGKTCTAYEILSMISTKITNKCAFFAELSKSREAKIFKQVLLAAMDNEFPNMIKSELVLHHINTGRIPLIIDGFDELLVKDQSRDSNERGTFNKVETMLSTIGDLLQNNAKVILTSRKTAIFTGKEFDEWYDQYNGSFKVTRFVIEPPRIKDWLDVEKYDILNFNNVPLNHLANPVLLAYLRSMKLDDFNNVMTKPETLIEKYFDSIMEREIERQNLKAKPNEQLNIFKKLARLFVEYEISSESRENIKYLIIETNPNRLPEIRKNYGNPKPTIDEIADILANHALLDRKDNNDSIGFINDFIFGILIGDSLIQNSFRIPLTKFPQYFIEHAVFAYKYNTVSRREMLWSLMGNSGILFKDDLKFLIDISLIDYISSGYSDQTYSSFVFNSIHFDDRSSFVRCVFIKCKFIECAIDIAIFDDTTFIECIFENCSIMKSEGFDGIKVYAIKCKEYDCEFNRYITRTKGNDKLEDSEVVFEEKIICSLFKADKKSPRIRHLSKFLQDHNSKRKALLDALESLEKKGYIRFEDNVISITESGIKYHNSLVA